MKWKLDCKTGQAFQMSWPRPALGKPQWENIVVHLGIAQIAIGPPLPPHSNRHFVAPIFGQNHANARLYMDISPKNRCHKPSWQGFRPPHPNGQCPNEQRFSYVGASLMQLWFPYICKTLQTSLPLKIWQNSFYIHLWRGPFFSSNAWHQHCSLGDLLGDLSHICACRCFWPRSPFSLFWSTRKWLQFGHEFMTLSWSVPKG